MHEGELGGPLYRRPEAVAVNGNLRRVITAVLWMCSGIRGLSIVVEVHRSHLGAKRAGVWCFGVSSTERGGAGPSAAGSTSRACRPRWRCHGRALARMRPRGEQMGDGRRGTALSRRSCPLSAVTGSRPPQDTPARAARGATDAGKTPSARAGCSRQEEEAARNVPRALWACD